MGALILAEEIRDWVFLPISLVVFLVGVVRHYATLLIKATPKADLKNLRESQSVLRAQHLRTTCRCITKNGFRSRRACFTHKASDRALCCTHKKYLQFPYTRRADRLPVCVCGTGPWSLQARSEERKPTGTDDE